MVLPLKKPLSPCFNIFLLNGNPLKICNTVRDLGVIIDCELKFSEHISCIVRQAMLRSRLILRCFLSRNRDLLLKAFIAYVRPLLEYCSPVWSPNIQYLIDKIESVQKFFMKWIPGLWHVSYSERLRLLNLKSLEERCVTSDLSILYQMLAANINCELLDHITSVVDQRTRGHDRRLISHRFTKNITKYSFLNRTIRIWNKLPNIVVASPSISVFKRRLCELDAQQLRV